MKVPNNKIDDFIKNLPKNIKAVLIYGPDPGLVTIRVNKLHKNSVNDIKDVFCNVEFNYKDLKKDPALLNDELKSQTMFGGRKVIKIIDTESNLTKDIENIILNYKGKNLILIDNDELSPSSSLRKFFENNNNLAAIACYKDDATSLKQIITNYLTVNGYKASYEVINFLSEHFSGNRLIVISELEKLLIYKADNKNITLDDIYLIISNNHELSLENITLEFASLNSENLDKHLNLAFSENISAIAIIRILISYFLKLNYVQTKINSGMDQATAISSLKPPIFFKNIPLFKNHLNIWKIEKIAKICYELQELETKCKDNIINAETLTSHYLIFKINSLKKYA